VAINDPFGQDQVYVRIRAAAGMQRPRVGQLAAVLGRRDQGTNLARELDLLRLVKLARQREHELHGQSAVRTLMPVRCLPVAMSRRAALLRARALGLARPARHVARLDVQHTVAILATLPAHVLASTCDVVRMRRSRLTAGARDAGNGRVEDGQARKGAR
jgi:hypothetical protein